MGRGQSGSNRSVRTSWRPCSTMRGKQEIWPNRLESRVGNWVHTSLQQVQSNCCIFVYVCIRTEIGSTYVRMCAKSGSLNNISSFFNCSVSPLTFPDGRRDRED